MGANPRLLKRRESHSLPPGFVPAASCGNTSLFIDENVMQNEAVYFSEHVNKAECADKKFPWTNENNKAFYEAINAERLYNIAKKKAGLASGCDLKFLETHWSKTQSILEVGAGYGRIIECLLKNEFPGKIVAIERCNNLFAHLKKKFDKYKTVHLIHTDVYKTKDLNLLGQFDLIFMLWSTIADFSPKEQPIIIRKLKALLNNQGSLIIDTMPSNIIPLDSKKCGKQIYVSTFDGVSVYTYEPNAKDIKKYANEANFSSCTQQSYKTETFRERWIYILQ